MIHFFLGFFFFIVGTCVGSFCGVLMETSVKRSFWVGRSQCLTCHKRLKWYELIPVVSYIIQRGKCRHCSVPIPAWIMSIEMMNGLIWMLFGTIFVVEQYSVFSLISHLVILTMILMLALEDIKSFSIPDRLSIPMIAVMLCLVIAYNMRGEVGLFPSIRESLFGAAYGMVFYLVQMMIPGVGSLFAKKLYMRAIHVLFVPIFFPFWLAIKGIFGEEKADDCIPSIIILDNEPTWVGGGDVRLGMLLGLILGPIYFWWSVGIGYVIGTLFWLFSRFLKKKNLDILPVAPLLFLGFCITWMLLLFS